MAKSSSLLILALLIVGIFCAGCGGTRVVIAEEGRVVRLAEDVDARVYVEVEPGRWEEGSDPVTLKQGGYYVRRRATTSTAAPP